ncbi:hypothetical protein [Promicromonospora iranensis]|uniref:Uncharacterized protein n=1 Tax=Promicromonospora iranensis TaxID=1105144 RepID=A0ABU2CM96_9MICO|nr:hypothetical protein [Promicromonospora iranensis]MDR7382474.1 hypothetical protein [Promicromonospora iranensis]
MRTSRLISLMIALIAAIIWMVSTYANASNSWDPLNFVLRIAAGAVTIAATAEWLVLSVRESRREGIHSGGPRRKRAARRRAPAVPGTALEVAHPEPVVSSPEPAVPDEPAVRRSAGSGTVADKVVSVFGRRRSPAQDLAVVAGGGAVLVVAYLMERKVRRVVVRVGLDAASAASLESALGAAPHRVFGAKPPTRGVFDRSAYTQLEGASGSGAWSIAVPTVDVDLLRYVLARAEEVR